MSRNYDNWEKLVGAVLRRESDRQLAYCESLSTCYSADLSSRFSFDSAVEDADFSFNPFVGDVHLSDGIDKLMDGAEWRNWDVGFQPINDMMSDKRIVVYEIMPNGSLDNHLFTSRQEMLAWATRVKVAVGAARALAFLHGLEIPVILRNINSDDILLDADFNPKLSDFGLAIDGPTGGMTHVETQIMGKYGYAAPEYMATGHLTTRCDVYGFGVVLLELITGLRALDTMRPAGEHNLVDWAKPYLESKRRLSRIMDSRLKGQYPPKEAYKVANIGLQCISLDPRLRPTMVEVVAALEKL